MSPNELQRLTELLQRPGAVRPADGLEVRVRSVRLDGGSDPEVVIEYAVPPLPDGVALQPLPHDGQDLEDYASEVAQELHAWATEHVRRFRPLPPPDRDAVRRELPSREELWQSLVGQFTDLETTPAGFRGTNRFGHRLTVMITPEQWHDYVLLCEIACRNDYGVDADGPGNGPIVAIDDLDEALATTDADEDFLVLVGHRLVGSTRAELPPVPGTAGDREHEEMMRRIEEARRTRPDAPAGWFVVGRDGRREYFADWIDEG